MLVGAVAGIGFAISRYGSPTAPQSAPPPNAPLRLPQRTGEFDREASAGVTPSVHPETRVATVSAIYSRAGVQQFLALASRPQTNAEAALTEVNATGIVKHPNGVCGYVGTPRRLGCVVVRRDTAVMVVTLVDQPAPELLTLASTLVDGLGT